MNNVKSIISNHNKAQISKPPNQSEESENNCNCRNKNACPLEGNCNVRNIVYQAEVVTPQTKETYIGLCDTTFKERYRNHTCSFRNGRYKNVTELKPSFHTSGKSQTIGDFTVSRPSQTFPTIENWKS